MVEIRRIEVDKLFGLYDHRIDLHPDEHITLLHGPNGVGKTALLRLLNGLINGNYDALSAMPFNEFRVYFTDNRWIRVNKTCRRYRKMCLLIHNRAYKLMFCAARTLCSQMKVYP